MMIQNGLKPKLHGPKIKNKKNKKYIHGYSYRNKTEVVNNVLGYYINEIWKSSLFLAK